MSLQDLYLVLLAGGLVLLASIVATRAASRVRLPSLLLLLGVGVVVGEDGLGLHFDNYLLADHLGTVALAIILIEGGLTTRFGDVRKVLAPAAMLATVGIAVSMAVTAVGAHLLLGMDWQLALLLGAVVSSTDAAAVFSVLRVVPLPRRVAGLLEAASGFTAAPAVIRVLMFSATPLELSAVHALVELLYELGVGAAIGLGCGFIGSIALRRIALPASGLYPLATFGLGMVTFAAAGSAHASGFLAAYLAAVVLANSGLPHRSATRSFAEGLGWLAQIGLFVLLGLLVDPSDLAAELVPGIVIGLVLLLVARPLSSSSPSPDSGCPGATGLPVLGRSAGAVPIVLATFPIVGGVPDSMRLLNIVFILVVVFTLVQGAQPAPAGPPAGIDSQGRPPARSWVGAAPAGRVGGRTVDDDRALAFPVAHNVTVLELVRLPGPQRHHPSSSAMATRWALSRNRIVQRATNCSSSPPPRPARQPNGGSVR
jgi:cell volume regulation protein A